MDRLGAMTAFIRVVDAGSFSKAAASLQTTQPTLSKAIAQLERHLGVQLLLRSTRGLASTEAGAAFYGRARQTLEAAATAEQAARSAADGLSGRLRVGAPVTFGRLHVIPQLTMFMAQHPALHVELLLDDRNVNLLAEGLDVVLRMGELSDSTLTGRRIGQTARRVFATPSFFSHRPDPTHPADLHHHDAVLYSGGGGPAWTFRRGEEVTGITAAGHLSITAIEGVRQAVLAGLGYAVLSEWAFTDAMRSGEVSTFLTDWRLPPLDLWALYPTRRPTAKARAFVDMMAHVMS